MTRNETAGLSVSAEGVGETMGWQMCKQVRGGWSRVCRGLWPSTTFVMGDRLMRDDLVECFRMEGTLCSRIADALIEIQIPGQGIVVGQHYTIVARVV